MTAKNPTTPRMAASRFVSQKYDDDRAGREEHGEQQARAAGHEQHELTRDTVALLGVLDGRELEARANEAEQGVGHAGQRAPQGIAARVAVRGVGHALASGDS